MPYCVSCGVELAEKPKQCPLCLTPVMLPVEAQSEEETQGASLYPERVQRNPPRRHNLVPSAAVVLILSFLLLIPFLITLLIDLRTNGRVTWSFFPMASLVLLWLMFAYPLMLHKHTITTALTVDTFATALFLISLDLYTDNTIAWAWFPASALLLLWVCGMLPIILSRFPVLLACAYFISISSFLWLLEFLTEGRAWFIPLAMPLTGVVTVFGLGIWLGLKYFRRFYSRAALFTVLGTLALSLIDVFIQRYTTGSSIPVWSPLVAAVGMPLGALFLVANFNSNLQAYLQKKFHI